MSPENEPKQEAPGIRVARHEDIGQLSRALSLAFYTDPVYEWFFPRAGSRIERLRRLFAVFLEDLIPLGTVLATEGLEGASLWVPPGKTISHWQSVKQNLQVLGILGGGVPRGIWWWLSVESKQPRYPHWELFLIGVVPEKQGRGIGTALLRRMLDKCDDERLPIYLDTGNKANVAFYQRYGFEVKRKVSLPKGPIVFQMIRRPRGGAD